MPRRAMSILVRILVVEICKDINNTNSYIQMYFKASERLKEKNQDQEKRASDLKLKKYWGYHVVADKNLKDTMTLSEHLLDK